MGFTRSRGAVLVIVVSILGACTARSLYLPTTDRLRSEGAVDGGANVESLRRGRVVALTRCAECHRVFGADEVLPERWPSVVRDMGRRASLTRSEMVDLGRYFGVASRSRDER